MDLPPDLNGACRQCATALDGALADGLKRLQVDLRFEGLRWPRVAHQLCQLLPQPEKIILAFGDMGAAALARRDFHLSGSEALTFADLSRGNWPEEADLCMAVTPTAPDFTAFEAACTALGERPVIALNPRLEDAAVGIGRVARSRRRGFLALWQLVYGLYPLEQAALAYGHPGPWGLFREDGDGFRLVSSLPHRPDGATMDQLLNQKTSATDLAKAADHLLQQMS